MSHYAAGTRVEHAVIHALTANEAEIAKQMRALSEAYLGIARELGNKIQKLGENLGGDAHQGTYEQAHTTTGDRHMSGYSDGVYVEHKVIKDLVANGYEDHIRAAGSKGAADVVASKPGQVLFVNVKREKYPPPRERAALWRITRHLPGLVPLVALKPPRKPIEYRELTGTGPKDWRPWSPDIEETT